MGAEVELSPDGRLSEVVSAISRATDGANTVAFSTCLADPAVRVLTLNVTEAGSRRSSLAADLAALVRDNLPLRTAPSRVAGLRAR